LPARYTALMRRLAAIDSGDCRCSIAAGTRQRRRPPPARCGAGPAAGLGRNARPPARPDRRPLWPGLNKTSPSGWSRRSSTAWPADPPGASRVRITRRQRASRWPVDAASHEAATFAPSSNGLRLRTGQRRRNRTRSKSSVDHTILTPGYFRLRLEEIRFFSHVSHLASSRPRSILPPGASRPPVACHMGIFLAA